MTGMKPGIERDSLLQRSRLRRRRWERASALMVRISSSSSNSDASRGAVQVSGTGNTYRVTPGTVVAMLRRRGRRRGREGRRMASMDGDRLRVVMRVMIGGRRNKPPLQRRVSRGEIRGSVRPGRRRRVVEVVRGFRWRVLKIMRSRVRRRRGRRLVRRRHRQWRRL